MVPCRREWDVQLKSVMFPHDVKEVLKVRFSVRMTKDHVAWFYEKTGIFSVKSAYHLAVHLDNDDGCHVGSSARSDGCRPGLKRIWSANVPPKVKAWCLSQEGLATQSNRKSRGLEREATCQICGNRDETGYHAVVSCSMVVALRHEMRSIWNLLDEKQLTPTGLDWFIHLLCCLDDDRRDKTLLLFWRAWHHRNNIMHGNGRAAIGEPVQFLMNYVSTLEGNCMQPQAELTRKGKEVVGEGSRHSESQTQIKNRHAVQVCWAPPKIGWVFPPS
jgi:hypothetical protein